MKRRGVQIVAFVAYVVAMMVVSCSKEGVGGTEHTLTLGEIPDSIVNGDGMVQFNDRTFKKAMLEAWDSDRDGVSLP